MTTTTDKAQGVHQDLDDRSRRVKMMLEVQAVEQA